MKNTKIAMKTDKVYEELKRRNVYLFKVNDLIGLFKVDKTKSYNIIKSLKNKGQIKKINNGYYALKEVDEFVIASNVHFPSYISFWSALNYHGLSDQNPKKIFLATTKYHKDNSNYKYVTISKKRFFGYIKIGNIVMAEMEKALIDSLLFPKYAGGINEIIKCVNNGKNEIDINRLIMYSLKIEKKVVRRRLGFILEQLGYKEKAINKLNKNIGKGFEKLDPNLPKKNNLNSRWLLDINI